MAPGVCVLPLDHFVCVANLGQITASRSLFVDRQREQAWLAAKTPPAEMDRDQWPSPTALDEEKGGTLVGNNWRRLGATNLWCRTRAVHEREERRDETTRGRNDW